MEAPHDDLSSKWGTIGALGTVIGTGVAAAAAYVKALNLRRQGREDDLEERDPEEKHQLSLRALDKKIKDHDNRLDEIDLHLSATDRRLEEYHADIMRQLKRIVGSEAGSQ